MMRKDRTTTKLKLQFDPTCVIKIQFSYKDFFAFRSPVIINKPIFFYQCHPSCFFSSYLTHFFYFIAASSSSHVCFSQAWATVPLPACLSWHSPLYLPLSMYFALIRRDYRQTVLTVEALQGCCRVGETTSTVNSRGRWEEGDRGEEVGGMGWSTVTEKEERWR